MAVSPIIGIRLDRKTVELLDDEAEQRGHTRASYARHLIVRQLPKADAVGERQRLAGVSDYRSVGRA